MIQDTHSAVPRPATARTGPLRELKRHFPGNRGEIEPLWIRAIQSAAERLATECREVLTIDRFVVGRFRGIHTGRTHYGDLNIPGMQFEPQASTQPCSGPDGSKNLDECANRFYAYSIVTRLAPLAAAREQRRLLEPPVSEPNISGLRQ